MDPSRKMDGRSPAAHQRQSDKRRTLGDKRQKQRKRKNNVQEPIEGPKTALKKSKTNTDWPREI